MKKILLTILVLFVASCGSEMPPPSEASVISTVRLPESEIVNVHHAVRARLLDPINAKFGPHVAMSVTDQNESYKVVCGYVDFRGTYGYLGYRLYIASDQTGAWLSSIPTGYTANQCIKNYGFAPPPP